MDRLSTIVSVCALVWLTGCGPSSPKVEPAKSAPTPPIQVKITLPRNGEITRSITLPGEVRAYQQATLYAKVAGYLKKITVDTGDAVKEGDLLADIEVPEMIADLARAKTEAEVAALDYKRVTEAFKKAPDLVTPQSIDAAKGKFDIAKASLERIESLLSFAKITAPFSGVITRRMVDPGAFIPVATSGNAAQNAALFVLMNFSKVRVQVAIPEAEAPLITKGLKVRITVDELPGRVYEGGVTRYAYALDDATKTMLTEIEIPNPKGELRPGMYPTVKVVVERKPDALIIPIGALVMEKANASVFTLSESKEQKATVAKKVAIKTGFNDGVSVEILEGLKPNEPVILVGKQPPINGQAVIISEAK